MSKKRNRAARKLNLFPTLLELWSYETQPLLCQKFIFWAALFHFWTFMHHSGFRHCWIFWKKIIMKFSSRLKNKIKLTSDKSNNLLLLKLKKMTSGLLRNLEQNRLLLNLESFTSHFLKNPGILLNSDAYRTAAYKIIPYFQNQRSSLFLWLSPLCQWTKQRSQQHQQHS